MHADKRDPIGGSRRRQNLQELLVAVTGERGDDHGVEARTGALTRAHVRVGVDPKDRQIIAVLVNQVRNGAMLTEHSPPTVVMRAGSCSEMIASALRSC